MDTNQDLEAQYSPSHFSERFKTSDEIINHHIQFISKESEISRLSHDCHLNIAYGQAKREKLDIYGDNLKRDSPLFVYVHGGYWQLFEFDKWHSAYVVAPLVQKGIRVIVIDYELCPTVTLEEVVKQVQKAFKWVAFYVRKYKIQSVSIAGHSAGAHLIACALTKEITSLIAPEVKFSTFLISGVYDLNELRHLKVANEGNILSLTDDNVRQLSPQFHNFDHLQGQHNFKMNIVVGEHESEKFKQQSKGFAEKFNELSFVTHEVLPGLDHFDIVEKLAESDYELLQSIAKSLLEV